VSTLQAHDQPRSDDEDTEDHRGDRDDVDVDLSSSLVVAVERRRMSATRRSPHARTELCRVFGGCLHGSGLTPRSNEARTGALPNECKAAPERHGDPERLSTGTPQWNNAV
jgi:hypothetical protein